ncbi:hypothetical protein [Methylobacterium sp. R2-1]|uniref:hypothetical protein n=1 Tax=Methylobacterium sp. R2-1 TaxID=2587064 RepID=UPI00161BB3C5|nr:hypothetical protein [Methylobacterium sp. R2-1]MBB2964349.1 hypothetical protein [Methylobacterium sp. R2-1]
MTRLWTSATLIVAHLLAPVRAEPTISPAARTSLPADVVAYLDRRMGCNHWSGEDAYDAARGRQIAALRTLRCEAVEADEKRLRRRYGCNPAVLKALDAAEHADG